MSLIGYLFGSLLIFVITMIAHEIGHYTRSTELGYLSRIGFDKQGLFTEFPDNASSSDTISILSFGIFLGLAVLVFLGFLFVPFALPGLLIAYYFGIKTDLKMIKEAKNRLDKRK